MIDREIMIWIGVIAVFNPLLTRVFIVRIAKVNRKGTAILYSITTSIALFWCGVSTGYLILSVIPVILFASLVIFKNRLLVNIRQDA